jgi:hypothetical protein
MSERTVGSERDIEQEHKVPQRHVARRKAIFLMEEQKMELLARIKHHEEGALWNEPSLIHESHAE